MRLRLHLPRFFLAIVVLVTVVVVVVAAAAAASHSTPSSSFNGITATSVTTASSSSSSLSSSSPTPLQDQAAVGPDGAGAAGAGARSSVVLIVGSANADTYLPVARLPREGENLTLLPGTHPIIDEPGGKGCTQAVAVSRLLVAAGPSSDGDDDGGNGNIEDDGENGEIRPPSASAPARRGGARFVGQVGLDEAGRILLKALEGAGVDAAPYCGRHPDLPSGRGYVLLASTPAGSVSAVVSGGSNLDGWKGWEETWEETRRRRRPEAAAEAATEIRQGGPASDAGPDLDRLLEGVDCILLQREVPEYVNLLIASHAKDRTRAHDGGGSGGGDHSNDNSIRNTIVFLDIGGEDRPISTEMLQLCDYVTPNETELKRLVESTLSSRDEPLPDTSSCDDDGVIVAYARILQQLGANHVLVTRGARGSTLVPADGRAVLHQRATPVPSLHGAADDDGDDGNGVVDETGAGDCFRAAFAVALLEGHSWGQCLQFASAAGSCSVQVRGAVNSAPTRSQVLHRLLGEGAVLDVPRGDGQSTSTWGRNVPHKSGPPTTAATTSTTTTTTTTAAFLPRGGSSFDAGGAGPDAFPFLIGSRLNSMKDRPDLWGQSSLETPRDYVERQATVAGLTCVDFNYPQHFGPHWTACDARAALDAAGLVAGAICLRYPPRFARGAMNHPDLALRREALELTKQAAEAAAELGCDEVVVWSAYDGYDYPFQVDYDDKWDQLVDSFRELCDAYPSIKFSLEFKPTDENTRFFTVSSTGAALLFVLQVDRPNMGLTLDVGHMLMAGENPGQSVAMVGRHGRLFGIQLNDGYTRLAAEDGLMFGSCHPAMALEVMYQLKRTNFRGHVYFDTFPQRTDPVREAEHNIRQVKRLWSAACALDGARVSGVADGHDAVGALELVDGALYGGE